jgi:hypothetical protein
MKGRFSTRSGQAILALLVAIGAAGPSPGSLTVFAAGTATIGAVQGRFYSNGSNSGGFNTQPSTPPLWTQTFNLINFDNGFT